MCEPAKRQRKEGNRTRHKLVVPAVLSELFCFLFKPIQTGHFTQIHSFLLVHSEQIVNITWNSWITSYSLIFVIHFYRCTSFSLSFCSVLRQISAFNHFKGWQNDEFLSMYIINTLPRTKCFVQYVRTRFCVKNRTRKCPLYQLNPSS